MPPRWSRSSCPSCGQVSQAAFAHLLSRTRRHNKHTHTHTHTCTHACYTIMVSTTSPHKSTSPVTHLHTVCTTLVYTPRQPHICPHPALHAHHLYRAGGTVILTLKFVGIGRDRSRAEAKLTRSMEVGQGRGGAGSGSGSKACHRGGRYG